MNNYPSWRTTVFKEGIPRGLRYRNLSYYKVCLYGTCKSTRNSKIGLNKSRLIVIGGCVKTRGRFRDKAYVGASNNVIICAITLSGDCAMKDLSGAIFSVLTCPTLRFIRKRGLYRNYKECGRNNRIVLTRKYPRLYGIDVNRVYAYYHRNNDSYFGGYTNLDVSNSYGLLTC